MRQTTKGLFINSNTKNAYYLWLKVLNIASTDGQTDIQTDKNISLR